MNETTERYRGYLIERVGGRLAISRDDEVIDRSPRTIDEARRVIDEWLDAR